MFIPFNICLKVPKIENYIRQIQFETRLGKHENVCKVFDEAFAVFKDNEQMIIYLK